VVGDYTALDDRIIEMVMFMRKNGVKRLVMTDGGIEIEFQDQSPVTAFSEFDSTGSDETSYYYNDKDKN
jgi:hypothetical protein